MRLDKLLSHAGYGTRKQVKKLIANGFIEVNDEIITKVGFEVKPEKDSITYLKEKVHYKEFYYVMLNKPAGIISATEDGMHQTVIDWVELDYHHVDLFPVGRLDIDTTGLLLLTNNGQLAHQLLSPKKSVPKKYYAQIEGVVTDHDIDIFAKGIDLKDFTTGPAELKIIEVDTGRGHSEVEVVITEGKFHQVKRMFEAVGKKVIELHRLSMGPLQISEDLAIGEYRELNDEELELLKPFGLE